MAEIEDEINANADRIGEGLWNSMKLKQEASYVISVHNTFKELLKLRAEGTLSEQDFFSTKNPIYVKANDILQSSIKGSTGTDSMLVLDLKGTIVAGTNIVTALALNHCHRVRSAVIPFDRQSHCEIEQPVQTISYR